MSTGAVANKRRDNSLIKSAELRPTEQVAVVVTVALRSFVFTLVGGNTDGLNLATHVSHCGNYTTHVRWQAAIHFLIIRIWGDN